MSFRLFSIVVALAVTVVLTGCQTNSASPIDSAVASHTLHETNTISHSEGLTGIWTGQLLDASDKVFGNVEWTVGQDGQFTGMMGSASGEGNAPIPAAPMRGSIEKNKVVGNFSGSGSQGGAGGFDGTVLHSSNTMTGTIILHSGQGNAQGIAMKIRLELERKPE
jgi:hypothetical protein